MLNKCVKTYIGSLFDTLQKEIIASVTRAKPNEKMAFPAEIPHSA